jgi:hypothetical protein
MANAANSAANSAAQSAVNAVNDAVASPATERYPGAVDPSQYGVGSGPVEAGGPSGPVAGEPGENQFPGSPPRVISGGGYQDTGWLSGHDAPQVPWDSQSQTGAYVAPSYPGAINPELHGDDTGGVRRKEYAVPAAINPLTRRTSHGQTTVRSVGTLTLKDGQTSPNDRTDMDQYQSQTGGYTPHVISYAERPINNNLAYQAVAITPEDVQYVPSGGLLDNAPYTYGAQVYEAPQDPYVGTNSPAAAGDPGIGNWWV